MTTTTLPAQFPFFATYSNALAAIPEESDRAKLALAICEYGAWGTEPDFGDRWGITAAFEAIRINLDNSVNHYVNGKKGGRPRRKSIDVDKLAEAYAICQEPIPDDILEHQAQYMSEEYEREQAILKAECDAETWIG